MSRHFFVRAMPPSSSMSELPWRRSVTWLRLGIAALTRLASSMLVKYWFSM